MSPLRYAKLNGNHLQRSLTQEKKLRAIKSCTKKLEVDHNTTLSFYYHMADDLLNKASGFRVEKNLIDLYISLVRFSSLLTETIPSHKEYQHLLPKQKDIYREKLVYVLKELESLKPEIQLQVIKLRRTYSVDLSLESYWLQDQDIEAIKPEEPAHTSTPAMSTEYQSETKKLGNDSNVASTDDQVDFKGFGLVKKVYIPYLCNCLGAVSTVKRASRLSPIERASWVVTRDFDVVLGGAEMQATKDAAESIEEEVGRLVEEAKELQESVAGHISKTSNEEQSLRQRVLSVDSSIRCFRSSIESLLSQKVLDVKLAEKLYEDLNKIQCVMADGDSASFLPSKVEGRFLRMFLGPINVRAGRRDIRLKVKEEYNSYRDRTALLFLFFPSLLLILRSWIWNECLPAFPVQLYQSWLLFLYTGLALRENILRVNGSDIRPWWIYHHYCAMGMALVSLTWEIKGPPDCSRKQRGVQLFLQWAMMQGVAMLLQNRYQRQRLYTRIALGKAKRMDIVWGETAGVEGQLWLLCPILFILQGFEAYVGLLLLRAALDRVVTEWQVPFCGILLVFMAIGNFVNTVQTLMSKSRFKAKVKRNKSKHQ